MTTENEPAGNAPGDDDAAWKLAMEQAAATSGKAPVEDDPAPAASKEMDEAAGAPPADSPPPDPWADAPEPLKAAYQQTTAERDEFRTKWERQRSELGGQTRKIKELAKQIKALEGAKAQGAPAEENMDDVIGELADYPEVQAPFAKLLSYTRSLEQKLQNVQAEIPVGATPQEELESTHPDWLTVIQGNSDAFGKFLDSDPLLSAAFEMNREEITDAKAASALIDRFKRSLSGPPPQKPTPRTDDRRQRQLAGSAAPAPRGGGANVQDPSQAGDEDAQWRRALALAAKTAHR